MTTKIIALQLYELFYDKKLLPFCRENYANHVALAGVWLSRFSLVCFFIIFVIFFAIDELNYWLRYLAIALSVAASLSDWLDGHIARKYNCITAFGKIFDPHHDKIQYHCRIISLVMDAFIFYIITREVVFLISAVVLKYFTGERDETVSFHRLWAIMVSDRSELQARENGKWRTRICFSGLPLLHAHIFPLRAPTIFSLVSALLISVTIWSLYDYVNGYREKIKKVILGAEIKIVR